MQLAIYLALLLLCVSTHCDDVPTDAEIEAAFQEAEEALIDHKEIIAMFKDVKASLAKQSDYKKGAFGIAKAVSSAVPKLMSGNGNTIADGALTLAAGIAENLPVGSLIASVATLIASIIGIVNTDKTNKIRDTMTKVLQEAGDEELIEKIDSFKAKINVLISFMEPLTKRKIKDSMLSFIAVKTEHASAVGVLPVLKKRIFQYRSSDNPAVAKRAFDFSVIYAQLVTMQDLALTQVILLLEKGNSEIGLAYANAKNGIVERSRAALSFWNHPKPEHAGSLVHYYPLGSSASGKFLRAFLKRISVPEAEEWYQSSYVLISAKWPSYHLYYTPHVPSYLSFSNSKATTSDKIAFDRREDGYYTLRSARAKYAYVEDPASPWYIVGKKRHPGDDKNHHFIVINYPGTDIITISCRNWPHKFFGGEINKYSVILKDGNIGPDIQYYTHYCIKQRHAHLDYECLKYVMKDN